MVCNQVLARLSEFLDEVLDEQTAGQMAQHLSRCPSCRSEYEKLSLLQSKLRSLGRIQAPPYLRRLVEIRIAELPHEAWHVRLQEEIRRIWSAMRTLESTWYLTRALGTVAASVFFILITFTINPIYHAGTEVSNTKRVSRSADYGRQVGRGVLAKLGMIPARPLIGPRSRYQPAIHDLYFLNYGMSVPRTGSDDTFSVVTLVDPTGVARIQNILEYPSDQNLLRSFIDMISSARCRPATRNGEAVPSHLVLIFSKVSVYD